MIYQLNEVSPHGVFKLNEVVVYFFKTGISQSRFTYKCFPLWFRPILNKSKNTKESFQKVFKEIKKSNPQVYTELSDCIDCLSNVKSLCEDKTIQLKSLSSAGKPLHDAINHLMIELYENTLSLKVFEKSIGGKGIHDHYIKFRNNGNRICPFCGLTSYTDRGLDARAAYDHFLPKKIYPLVAVNFANLIPICTDCNNPPNKGQDDILFKDKERRSRQIIHYPYSPGVKLLVNVSPITNPSVTSNGIWRIELLAAKQIEAEMVESWERVFKISRRYKAKIEEESRNWLCEFLRIKNYQTKPTISDLRHEFSNYSNYLIEEDSIKTRSLALVQSAFFKFLATKTADSEILSYVEISTKMRA